MGGAGGGGGRGSGLTEQESMTDICSAEFKHHQNYLIYP